MYIGNVNLAVSHDALNILVAFGSQLVIRTCMRLCDIQVF